MCGLNFPVECLLPWHDLASCIGLTCLAPDQVHKGLVLTLDALGLPDLQLNPVGLCVLVTDVIEADGEGLDDVMCRRESKRKSEDKEEDRVWLI